MQYKQQANPLFSMDNYTPLVISGNYKKQITFFRSTVESSLRSRKHLILQKKVERSSNRLIKYLEMSSLRKQAQMSDGLCAAGIINGPDV